MNARRHNSNSEPVQYFTPASCGFCESAHERSIIEGKQRQSSVVVPCFNEADIKCSHAAYQRLNDCITIVSIIHAQQADVLHQRRVTCRKSCLEHAKLKFHGFAGGTELLWNVERSGDRMMDFPAFKTHHSCRIHANLCCRTIARVVSEQIPVTAI